MTKDELVKLVMATPTSKALFRALGYREREPQEGLLSVRALVYEARKRDGVTLIEKDYLPVFERLEARGLGKIVTNKGREPSFRFNKDQSVLELAQKAKDILSEQSPGAPLTLTVPPTNPSAAPGASKSVVIMFSPNRGASCLIPSDITADEITFLTSVIKAQTIHSK